MGSTNVGRYLQSGSFPKHFLSLIDGMTLTCYKPLIGYSAMAEQLVEAVWETWQSVTVTNGFRPEIMAIAVVVILIIVEQIQMAWNHHCLNNVCC